MMNWALSEHSVVFEFGLLQGSSIGGDQNDFGFSCSQGFDGGFEAEFVLARTHDKIQSGVDIIRRLLLRFTHSSASWWFSMLEGWWSADEEWIGAIHRTSRAQWLQLQQNQLGSPSGADSDRGWQCKNWNKNSIILSTRVSSMHCCTVIVRSTVLTINRIPEEIKLRVGQCSLSALNETSSLNMSPPSLAFVPSSSALLIPSKSLPCRVATLEQRRYRLRVCLTISCHRANQTLPACDNSNEHVKKHSDVTLAPTFQMMSTLTSLLQATRSQLHSAVAFLTVFALKHASFADTTEQVSGQAADAASSLPGASLPKIDSGAVSDSLSQAEMDDSLLSKVLVYLAFFLLVYVTIGSIALGIINFRKKRNLEDSDRWIQARLDGEPFPSNWFLDNMEDTSLPSDLPRGTALRDGFEPSKKPNIKRRIRSKEKSKSATQASDTSMNRQFRREKKKSDEKNRSDSQKSKKKFSIKEASAQRAMRKAEADLKKKRNDT